MNQLTDKFGNIIVEEIYDATSNLSYQKLRRIGGDILEKFCTYDVNNKMTYCKRILHFDKKHLVNEIFYEYGADWKRILEKDIGLTTTYFYDYNREIIHMTRNGRSQTMPMLCRQLDLFEAVPSRECLTRHP